MKYFLVFIQLFLIVANLSAQNEFVILGKTNFINNGKAVLHHEALEAFFIIQKTDTVSVTNHHFTFKSIIQYPLQFRVSVIDSISDERYMSEPFFIDSGKQEIIFNAQTKVNLTYDFGYGILVNGSTTNHEYMNKYLPLFNAVNQETEIYFSKLDNSDTIKNEKIKYKMLIELDNERERLRGLRDNILFSYALKYPNSNILSWLLYESLRKYGYKEIYQNVFDEITNHLPHNINKCLNDYIIIQKSKAVGNKFPLVGFIDRNISKCFQKNKFVLVDFWFSGCRPCIAQFKKLKPIYEKYKDKKFEIIAISTDTQKTLSEYREVLKLNNYLWKQILDMGGKEASLIDIQKYPTNFLLDASGKIIKVDINLNMLDSFLEENL